MARRTVALRAVTPADETAIRARAYAGWLASADTEFLECRLGRHRFPGITDREHTRAKKQRDGTVLLEAGCERCGTRIVKLIGAGGYLGDARTSYSYPDGYLLPAEARGGRWVLDKEQRAAVFRELVRRRLEEQRPKRRKR